LIRDVVQWDAVESLSIECSHPFRPGRLPAIQGGPFDGMVVASLQTAGIPILTVDPAISRHGIETTW
jgi:PIN domain nuclease of toxin-antitoxin system